MHFVRKSLIERVGRKVWSKLEYGLPEIMYMKIDIWKKKENNLFYSNFGGHWLNVLFLKNPKTFATWMQ